MFKKKYIIIIHLYESVLIKGVRKNNFLLNKIMILKLIYRELKAHAIFKTNSDS